eukprot:NODE_463_length_7125_cov_0.998292.p1 type:complete len:579 gc:universal NODE_463_length_7125_cov_0.998292:2971-1235(-)
MDWGDEILPCHKNDLFYRLDDNLVEPETPKVRTVQNIRICSWNVNGLRAKIQDIQNMFVTDNVDLVFACECKVANDYPLPSNCVYFNTNNTPYGCCLFYNPKKFVSGHLNVSGSPFHILLKLRSIDLLFVYKKHDENPLTWFERIRPLLSEKVIVFGDININLLAPLQLNEISFFDSFAAQGLLKYDVEDPDNLTFMKNGAIGLLDFLFYKSDTSYFVNSVEHLDLLHLSDHKALLIDIDLDNSNVILFPKRPRWNVKKLEDENNLMKYTNEMNIRLIEKLPEIEQNLLEMENNNLSASRRNTANNAVADTLISIINQAANIGCSKTRRCPEINCAKLTNLSSGQLSNHDIASRIVTRARQIAHKICRNRRDASNSTGFLKMMKISSKRKGMPKQHLDRLKMDEHIDKWTDKWSLDDQIHDPYISETLNHVEWRIYEIEEFTKILKSTPKSKSSGPDGVMNELLHNSTTRFIEILLKYFNVIGSTGLVPNIMLNNYIVPIHKGKDQCYEDILGYRPICLCNMMRKLFEMLLKPQIMGFLQTTANQFGFKTRCSTMDAAWYLEQQLVEMGHIQIAKHPG